MAQFFPEQLEAMRTPTRVTVCLLPLFAFSAFAACGPAPARLDTPVASPTTIASATPAPPTATEPPATFDGDRAYQDVLAQMELGPRITGTQGGVAAGDLIASELEAAGWQIEFQPFTYQDTPARNVIGRGNLGAGPIVILGAHYDTRRRADQDPEHPGDPVPGANDGASGVAVLLELARTLNLDEVPYEIWLAFFDAEDNGNLDGWDWIIGSQHMADGLTVQPVGMILVDMIGDADQQIFYEGNSDPALMEALWTTAAGLGYEDHFIPQVRYTMLDDHIPFRSRGIPAVDIIDFDYPYWHTVDDTADKVSAASLERVGRTLEVFLETQNLPTATPTQGAP